MSRTTGFFKNIWNFIRTPGDFISNLVVDVLEEKGSVLEDTEIANYFPSPKEFLTENGIKQTKSLVNELQKKINNKKESRLIKNSYKTFNIVVKKNCDAILKELKSKSDFNETYESYMEAKSIAEAAESLIHESKFDAEEADKELYGAELTQKRQKSNIINAAKNISNSKIQAESNIKLAKERANEEILQARNHALKIIQKLENDEKEYYERFGNEENLEKILIDYKTDKKEQTKLLEGSYNWGITLKGDAKEAKLAYYLYHNTYKKPKIKLENAENIIKKLSDEIFGERVADTKKKKQERENILMNKPKFSKTYEAAGYAWKFLNDQKFEGEYKSLEDDYNLLKTPSKFTGKYKDLKKDLELTQLQNFTKKKAEEKKNKIKNINEEDFSKYVAAVDNFNRAMGKYTSSYEKKYTSELNIKTKLNEIYTNASKFLKDHVSGSPQTLKDEIEKVQNQKKFESAVNSKIGLAVAVALVGALANSGANVFDEKNFEQNYKPTFLKTQNRGRFYKNKTPTRM